MMHAVDGQAPGSHDWEMCTCCIVCHDKLIYNKVYSVCILPRRWWKDLDTTLNTDDHVDLKTVHKLHQ